MFWQKVRAVFEWLAQKRAAKDREVLNYQWTTYRSNKDDQESTQKASQISESSTKKRTRSATKPNIKKISTSNDFTTTISSDTSHIEPQVEIDVDALFDEATNVSESKTETRVAKPKAAKITSSGVKRDIKKASKGNMSKSEKVQKDGAEEKPQAEVKTLVKKRTAKPRASKTAVKGQNEIVSQKEKAVEVTEKVSAGSKSSRKREIKAISHSSSKSTKEKASAGKLRVKAKTTKATADTSAIDYREIVRGNTLKGLQELLQDKYPQVLSFRKKFDMSAFLRETPEAVDELIVKLGK